MDQALEIDQCMKKNNAFACSLLPQTDKCLDSTTKTNQDMSHRKGIYGWLTYSCINLFNLELFKNYIASMIERTVFQSLMLH